MTTPKGYKKGQTRILTTNDSESSQGNEFSDYEGNSSTVLQTSSKYRTRKMNRNMEKNSYEDERRPGEEQILGRASGVFTFKLSIPAVVVTIAMVVYIIQAQKQFETKFAVLMKYEVQEYLEKLKTLSEKVPSLKDGLFKLDKQLVLIDECVVNLRSEMTIANYNWKNVEMRIKSISGISSKLEVDLPQQQQRFIEITKNLESADNDISNFSEIIDSMKIKTTDITKNLEIAFQNQSILNDLLNKTTAKAEFVDTTVSVVHTVITEINKHLPTLENMNKSVSLIMSSYHLLPLMGRSLEENKVHVHELEVGVNKTESRLNDMKESSVSVSEAVSLAVEKQTNIEENIKLSNEDLFKLKQDLSNTDENIKNSLTKLAEDLKISEANILDKTSQLNTAISTTEVEIGSMVDKVIEYNGKLGRYKNNVDSLSVDVNEMKLIVDYAGLKVRELEIVVRNLQSQNIGENIKNRLTKLAEDLETSDGKILKRTSQLNNDISNTEDEIGIMVDKVDEYSRKIGQFKSNVDSLSADVFKMKPIVDYAGLKVKELDIVVRNLQSQNMGLFQPINVCVALSFILIAALFYMIHFRYDNDGTQFTEHQRTELHSTPPFMSQTLPSILDRNHRVPVLDNKVCVLSFYSETMNLHRTLVESALATSRRGNNVEIIKHLVRRHEDILSIPSARYIFVFVDYNERNVILEHPGLDIGDKKLVTVQAAQKIGADVFVTYVRDRGSTQLLPGNLYNQELSAFTRHRVLKELANKKRCFSVYETFNNTQKESIVRSIS